MREIRTSGSMSGEWNQSTVGYSGTGNRKGRPHARPHLNHCATPRLYYFEKGEEVGTIGRQSKSLLAAVAIALGRCGRGVAHWHEAHEMLTRLSTTAERDVRTVASHALAVLGPEVCPNA